MKSPFFHVDQGLESIRFFDYVQQDAMVQSHKASSKRLGLRAVNRRNNAKDTKASIHTSGKKFSSNFSKRITETMTFGKKGQTTRQQGSGKEVSGFKMGPSSAELNLYIEQEMMKFQMELAKDKLDLVISQEEFQVINI